MAVRHGALDGIPVVVTRLSFSGERAYEVHCGAGHGLSVWTALMAAGAASGIVPYGTEAAGDVEDREGARLGPRTRRSHDAA